MITLSSATAGATAMPTNSAKAAARIGFIWCLLTWNEAEPDIASLFYLLYAPVTVPLMRCNAWSSQSLPMRLALQYAIAGKRKEHERMGIMSRGAVKRLRQLGNEDAAPSTQQGETA